ncbi:AAA family ATPase [Archangium sp.]|uniref:AAA family ATPase n=1 Tax=Archangium sp. TaxID=1872627 RepID=UPI002D51FCC3|nr:AAA family ATPase [Archangium sp.]HYO58077.1 AAA family ATPase [Archangium sp.]
MAFTLSVRNYRGLRRVEWSPSGVCALVGPNGSGKTTLIDVLQLLQDATTYGLSKAIEEHGGAYGLHHFAAPQDEPISFELRVGSASWEVQPEVSLGPGGARLPFWEKLSDGERTFFEKGGPSADSERRLGAPVRDDYLGLSTAMKEPEEYTEPVWGLLEIILYYRHYRHYALARLRREGSLLSGDLELLDDGRNLFAVLMNWRNRRDQRKRWAFVSDTLRDCYPELFSDFSFPIAANIVSCEVHTPNGHALTPALLPDGFLAALIHLCAVASSRPGGVLAIDEPENALHPYTIRRLMDAFREWSDAHDVTVLLATHSPVILDTFKELPEKVFVMQPEQEVLPVPLDQLMKRSWLAHFSLGDLYEHLKYGAPAGADEA